MQLTEVNLGSFAPQFPHITRNQYYPGPPLYSEGLTEFLDIRNWLSGVGTPYKGASHEGLYLRDDRRVCFSTVVLWRHNCQQHRRFDIKYSFLDGDGDAILSPGR